jgi:Amt family ammonium transporter
MMDIRMPVMNGVEATRRIKNSEGGTDTVVIAVSASAMEEERIEVLSCGADDFIRKPFKEHLVLEALKHHLKINYSCEGDESCQEPAHATHNDFDPDLIPGTVKENIVKAVHGGYHEDLLTLISEVGKSDPGMGKYLKGLADEYEYSRLLSIFSPRNTKEDAS